MKPPSQERAVEHTSEYEVNLLFITADADGPKLKHHRLKPSEELVKDLIDRLATIITVEKALQRCRYESK